MTLGDALEATVGPIFEGRVYAGMPPPRATYPLAQYAQIAQRTLPVLDGPHLVRVATIQLDIYDHQTPAPATGHATLVHIRSARDIALTVESAMEGFRGLHDDVEVKACYLQNALEGLDHDGNLARVTQTYEIWWRKFA